MRALINIAALLNGGLSGRPLHPHPPVPEYSDIAG
jgi:hypothetical protein